jgi:hypothetical protein
MLYCIQRLRLSLKQNAAIGNGATNSGWALASPKQAGSLNPSISQIHVPGHQVDMQSVFARACPIE